MAKPKIEKIYNSNGELNAIVRTYDDGYVEIDAFNIDNPQEYIKKLHELLGS